MTTRDGITTVTSNGRTKYRARISITEPDGTRRHPSKTFETKKAAQAWLNDRRRERDRGELTVPAPATVAEVAARWLADADRRLAPSTALQYRRWTERVVLPRFGDRQIGSIRATDIQRLYDALADDYSGGSLANLHKVMRGIFGYAVTDGLIRVNPAEGRRVPVTPPKPAQSWTPDEVRRFVQVAAADPAGAVLVLLVSAGLRIGEALALHWSDVDLDDRTIRVHRTLQRTPAGLVIAERTKTGMNRTVALPAAAVLALRGVSRTGPLVFPGRDGGIRHPTRVAKHLKDTCDTAGVPRLTPHGLRRMAATLLMRQGVHPAVAARMLGHSIEVALERYAQVHGEDQARAAEALDAALTAPESDAKTGRA